MPHASQGQCTALTKLGRTNGPLRSIMTDLRDARQDHSSGGDDLATRSSISSSSASTMSSAMSLSTIEDGASSDTDSEIARDMDLTVVKIERNTESASASPTNLHDPIHNYLISPVPPAEAGSQAIAVPKRGRGRPRKNSISALSSPTFKAKTFVRSKTGCMTCRKRKKKCDERKPECTLPPVYFYHFLMIANCCQASIAKRIEWCALVILQKKNGSRERKQIVCSIQGTRLTCPNTG